MEEKPLGLMRTTVQPEWIDYNGHMNVAYYLLAFDRAFDHFMDHIGIDSTHRTQDGGSIFAAESHIGYHRELLSGEAIDISMQLLEHDDKRLRTFFFMHRAEDGTLAATYEGLHLYVNLSARRVMAMPSPVLTRVAALAQAHARLPTPPAAGRGIALSRRSG